MSVQLSPSSTSNTVAKLLETAQQLETQLNSLETTSDEANQLRIPLCETLSDILLTEPSSAVENDVPGRLWRHCFYNRIGPLRAIIAKHQRKHLDATKLQKNLQVFLAESVTFYEFLLDRLWNKITHHDDEGESKDTSVTESPNVLPCLYLCYIHLGDLYRYSQQIPRAQESYTRAARLGPGHGHAYNQLAVTHQDAPVVAFYWYARALLAQTHVFATASGNLQRLLVSNRETLPPSEPQINSSKIFLAHLIDLHYRLTQEQENTLEPVLEQRMQELEALLENSALGDALLCKLVVIHAFSVTQTNGTMAKIANYRFGIQLAKRILKQKRTSQRLLLPFGLLAEYCISLPSSEVDDGRASFWEHFCDVWNLLVSVNDVSTADAQVEPYEYVKLRGFAPFCHFLNLPKDGYLAPEQAVAFYTTLMEGAATPETGTVASTNPDENKIKIARILRLGRTLAENTEFSVQMLQHNELAWIEQVNDDNDDIMGDDAEDVLVYRQSDGDGPELLMPTTLLASNESAPKLVPGTAATPSADTINIKEGFANTMKPDTESRIMANASNTEPVSTSMAEKSKDVVMGGTENEICSNTIVPQIVQPPPGFNLPFQTHGATGRSSVAPFKNGKSLDLHGDPKAFQTSNPFATSLWGANAMHGGLFDPFYGEEEHEFLSQTAMRIDGIPLLDSGLLNSIFSDDSPRKTQNPFAT